MRVIGAYVLGVVTGAALSLLVIDRVRRPADVASDSRVLSGSGEIAEPGKRALAPVSEPDPAVARVRPTPAESQLSDSVDSAATGGEALRAGTLEGRTPATQSRATVAPDTPAHMLAEETLQRSRERLDAEPRDDHWAFAMEQSLSQFLIGHARSQHFEIDYITCRTSKCQIKALAADDSAYPLWLGVMHDLKQQSWAEFGNTGSGMFNSPDGRVVIVENMFRTGHAPQ